jgi:hypothetical protein
MGQGRGVVMGKDQEYVVLAEASLGWIEWFRDVIAEHGKLISLTATAGPYALVATVTLKVTPAVLEAALAAHSEGKPLVMRIVALPPADPIGGPLDPGRQGGSV